MKLMEYQNMRGGRVVLQETAKDFFRGVLTAKLAAQEWSSSLHAVGM